MKKLLSILLILLSITICRSQSQDLAALSNNSTFISKNSIFNKDDSLFGTIFFFIKDKIDKNNWKYEYVIFDKNLNKIASKEFIQKKHFLTYENYNSCIKMGDHLLVTVAYTYNNAVEYGSGVPKYLLSTYRSISLKDSSISDEFYFDNNNFQAVKTEDNDLKKSYKNVNNVFKIYPIDNKQYSGYLVLETSKDEDLRYKINQIKLFDLNKKPTWSYEFNQNATNKKFQEVVTISYPDDKAIIKMANYEKNKLAGFNIICVDLKTGKKDFDYELENSKSEFSHTVVIKKFDNKIYIVGQYAKYGKRTYYEDVIGLYRIELDAQGKEISKKYQPWQAAESFIKIKKNGFLEGGYRMSFKDYLIFRDGSLSYLSEKFKEGGQYSAPKTSDMVMLNFDSQFNVKGVQIIEKAKTKGYESDFLFSQYIKNDTGVVFFYQDYKKDPSDEKKKLFLGINKYIDGIYSYEEIPIQSKKDKFEINIYPAKEGYIQLREYNEKEQYNQIRLEKLNY
jgi:hypothetical protein